MTDELRVGDWKNDPVVFLKLKIRYAYLLGMLHAMTFYGIDDEVAKSKIVNEINDICGEVFNCGRCDELPTLDMIVAEDDYINTLFPIHEDMEE